MRRVAGGFGGWRWAALLVMLAPLRGLCAGRIEAVMNPAVELASVVQLLGSDSYRYPGFVRSGLPSVREAQTRFQPFRDHPAVGLTALLDAGGLDYVTRHQFLMQLTDSPDLRPRRPASHWVLGRAGGPERLDAWLAALRDFSQRSDFMTHFAAQSAALEEPLTTLQEAVVRADTLGKLETYTGLQYVGTYSLVVSPYAGPGGSGNSIVELEDGSYVIQTLFGPGDAATGKPVLWSENLEGAMWHELSHGVLDTLALIYQEEIERTRPLFKRLPFPCYGDWNQCVKEHVVRAVQIRLMTRKLGAKGADRWLKEPLEEGFLYLRDFVDRLAEYESDRGRYPSLADFYPRWIRVLDERIDKDIPDPKDRLNAEQPPADARWIDHATRAFKEDGERRRALRTLDLLIARDAQPRLLKLRALLLYASGELGRALEAAEGLRVRAPEDVEALLLRGLALEGLGRKSEAEEEYREGARLCAARAQGERSQACADAHLFIEGSPASPNSGEWRTQEKARRGIERLTARLEAGPDPAAYAERGVLSFLTGDPARALKDFDRALALKPDQLEWQLSRGVALQALGRREEAMGSYEIALTGLKDTDPLAAGELLANILSSRASLFKELENPIRAREDLERALRVAPPDWPRVNETRETLRGLARKAP